MARDCPLCNTASVIEEEENGKVHHVCVECGHIVEESTILTTDAPVQWLDPKSSISKFAGEYNTHAKRNQDIVSDPEGKKKCCHLIKTMGTQFKFREDMIEYATELFVRVYTEKVKRFRNTAKKALSVCCIYVTARDNDYGITVRDVAQFLDGEKEIKNFGAMLKILKTEYNIHVKDVGPALEAYNFLSKASFPHDLIKKTQEILQLLQQLWIVSGRSRTLCIIIAAYVAWKCEDPIQNKDAVRTFCRKFNFAYSRNLPERKKEIFTALHKLACQIPWLKRDSEIKVEYHLSDILKFQQSLKQRAIADAVSEFKEHSETEHDNNKRSLETVEDNGPFLPPNYKKQRSQRSYNGRESNHSKSTSLSKRFIAHDGKELFTSDEDEVNFDLGSDDDTEDYIIKEDDLKEHKARLLQDFESK